MKMSLMLKLSSIAILSSSLLLGANSDEKILGFLKNSIQSNNGFEVKDVSIKSSKDLKQLPQWKAYFINISLHVKKQNKDLNVTDVIFSNGTYFTKDLMNLDTKKSIKDEVSPNASVKLYKKDHLIAGDENAKNRLIVFSDPVCPFCMDFVPEAIAAAKKHPKEFALYYYHLPLQMHQSALGLAKAMVVAQKQGVKDVVLRTYEEGFDSKIGDDKAIAKAFNKALKTKITSKQMNEKWVQEEVEGDMKKAAELLVHGTPTLFVNEVKDPVRENFKALLKKVESKK